MTGFYVDGMELADWRKYRVVEWYVDALCPSGENDFVVNSETFIAESAGAAELRYRTRHEVGVNNELRAHLVE